MSRQDYLFAEYDLDDALRGRSRAIPESVEAIPVEQFNASTDEQLIAHLLAELHVEPLELYEDKAAMEQSPTKVDVRGDPMRDWGFMDDGGPRNIPGTLVQITIPFTGDPQLWRMKSNPWRMSAPRAQVRSSGLGGTLEIRIAKPHDVAEDAFKNDFESVMRDVRFCVETQRKQIDNYHNSIGPLVQSAVQDRRQRLAKHQGLSKILNIPLKPKPGSPPIEPIKVKQKITVPLPSTPKGGKPEPGITDEVFETILKIIRNQGKSFEATPKTFAKLDEEELRDVILANLNNYFEGGATGETFRKNGKTDINILDDKRAAFIGECKVWRGAGEVGPSIDQLISYLTWRDCKAALIFFNVQVKGFSSLLEKLPEALATHPNAVGKPLAGEAGEWRITCRSREDEQRHVKVHVFIFNLYA